MDYFKDLFRGETNVSPRFLSFIKYIKTQTIDNYNKMI